MFEKRSEEFEKYPMKLSVQEEHDSLWPVDKFEILQILILVEYTLLFGMCLALGLYLRRIRHVALSGDSRATRNILLPAFEPLLLLLGCTVGVYSIVMIVLMALKWNYSNILMEVFYSMRLFVLVLVMAFLLQKNVSIPALRRSVVISLILALYTLPVEILLSVYVDASDPGVSYVVMSASRTLLLLFFVFVFVRLPTRASQRTLREFCLFIFIHSFLQFGSDFSFSLGSNTVGFALTYATVLWTGIVPVVIWRVLKADTEFWRGLDQRAVELHTVFRHRHSIDERISSQGLHVLIEMHRKLIIDFAHLKLEKKIGTGSSAVVVSGYLDAVTPVAVKVYTPLLFDENAVAEFSQEAALCGALKHPNIVKFYGMCVYPPTICLVSELCLGTLGEITCAAQLRFPKDGQRYHIRRQLLLNVCYMLDAARAVAYMHSFSPSFLHRDIKPDNFLVDVHGTVKLTDFGESRCLARPDKPLSVDRSLGSAIPDTLSDYASFGSTPKAAGVESTMNSFPTMTVKGTVGYMAPEIINGKAGLAAYGEAADVYSLAMTMWDVLHPGMEKFPELKNNHLQVFASVVEGRRPAIELETGYGKLHGDLHNIIEAAWQPNARARPRSQDIVNVLESVQEELLAVFAMELVPELVNDTSYSVSSTYQNSADVFTGEVIVARLQDLKFVHNPCEAVRLGNAFMDAGLLHHRKHAYGFENTGLKYFFDDDNILLCQPLKKLKSPPVAIDTSDGSPLDDDLKRQLDRLGLNSNDSCRLSLTCSISEDHCSVQNNPTGSNPFQFYEVSTPTSTSANCGISCRCRKLGQRLDTTRTTQQRLRWRSKPAVDENVLTTRLLGIDDAVVTPKNQGNVDGLDFVALDVREA